MASPGPGYGQWTGYPDYSGPPPAPMVSNPQDQTAPSQAAPSQAGPSPTEPSPPADEESAPNPPQAQSAPQGPWDQDQAQSDDEDSAESFTWSSGQSHLGVMIMGLTPELRRFFGVSNDRGVLVAKVDPSSAAARAGVQVGDVLVRVGRQQVRTGSDVIQALETHGGGRLRVAVVRQGRIVRLDATMPGRRSPQNPHRPIQQDQI